MRQDIIGEQRLLEEVGCTKKSIESKSKAYECVDPYTLAVIEKIFPAPSHGLDFLARLLRNAQVVQTVLPGLEESGSLVAVISTRTIRLLANSIHMAYDTTHKYVATFCALGLLYRSKQNQQRSFVFPLQRYNPPSSLQALDRLISQSRPKVQQFARGVKKRFLELNPGLIRSEVLERPTTDVARDNRWLKTIFAPMLDIMLAEGIERTQGQRIVARVVNEVLGKVTLPLQRVGETASDTNSDSYITGKSTLSQQKGRLSTSDATTDQKAVLKAELIRLKKRRQESTRQATEAVVVEKVYPFQQKVSAKVDSNTEIQLSRQEHIPEQRQIVDSMPLEATESTYAVDPMHDLLALYYNLLDDERIDWSHFRVPKAFLEELYGLLYGYTLSADSLPHRRPQPSWMDAEIHAVRQLTEKYQYDFDTIYQALLYYTYRTDEDPLEEKTESTLPQEKVDPNPQSTRAEVDPKNKKKKEKKTFFSQKPAAMSENEYKQTLLVKLDFTPEDIESPMCLKLLARSLEDLEELVENYQRTASYWKDLDEQTLAEKKAELLVPDEVDSKLHSEEFNDLLRKRNIKLLFNNIINNITLRKDLKVFLAEVFDRKHVKIADDWFKVVDECDAEQLCAGFIDTVILLHSPTSKPIEKPGGFFNSRCRTIRDTGLPEDSSKRMARFAELTYSELVVELLKICEQRKA
ncbi:hypothetical protein ccbrp13_06660 [Ktedonobacteria bacterium brp13]|nr:hypothetical protein ccbrp13_06660 [Ktedonobacteria bacterium brp13]